MLPIWGPDLEPQRKRPLVLQRGCTAALPRVVSHSDLNILKSRTALLLNKGNPLPQGIIASIWRRLWLSQQRQGMLGYTHGKVRGYRRCLVPCRAQDHPRESIIQPQRQHLQPSENPREPLLQIMPNTPAVYWYKINIKILHWWMIG